MFDWSDMDKLIGRVEGIVQKHIDKEANDLEGRIANTKLTSILREVDTLRTELEEMVSGRLDQIEAEQTGTE